MRGFQRVLEEADASNLIGDVKLAALAAALLATFGMASAQQQPPASEPRSSMSERVLRDADSPMRWIKIQSESARKAAVSAAQASSPSPAVVSPPATKTASLKAAPSLKPLRVASAAATATDTVSNARVATSMPTANAAPRVDNATEEPLVTIDRADPEWDEDVMQRLRHGRVVVRFNVAEDGYLSRIQIVESSNSRLAGPVMGALMQWRFEPIAEPRVATVEFGFDLDSGRR
jgi:TonB family protein